MRKVLFYLWFILSTVCMAKAQMTTISATVTDSDGTVWANGTWKLSLVPNPSVPNIYSYSYQNSAVDPTVILQSGTLDGSGAFSTLVYSNSALSPIGSQWTLTVCPNASYTCGTIIFTAIGSSMNLSSSLTAAIQVPRFTAATGPYGYNDTEAKMQNIPGSNYFNVSLGCQRYYNGSGWACASGGGSSIQVQTNGVNNASQTLLNFENSSANTAGFSLTFSNPSGGIVQPEIGVSAAATARTALGLGTQATGNYPTLCSSGQFSQGLSAGSNNCATPAGGGNVTGPTSSTAGDAATFSDNTGTVIKDAGFAPAPAAAGDTAFPTSSTLTCNTSYSNGASNLSDAVPTLPTSGNCPIHITTAAGTATITYATGVITCNLNGSQLTSQTSCTIPAYAVGTITANSTTYTVTAWTTAQASGGVSNITITTGTTAISANSCNTVSTATMTGLATTMTVQFTPNSDVSAVVGWSPGSGGQLYFTAWPSAANTLSYYVCNPTSASITPGGSVTWNVSAK